MSPQTNRILELYKDPRRCSVELLAHCTKMEDGLRTAVAELERINNIKDGQPLISHNLMYYLKKLLE